MTKEPLYKLLLILACMGLIAMVYGIAETFRREFEEAGYSAIYKESLHTCKETKECQVH